MSYIAQSNFLGIRFDNIGLPKMLESLASRGAEAPFAYLVTPNVDHVVRLHGRQPEIPELLESYRAASWCLCDSRILASLAKLSGIDLMVTPGSDLTATLIADAIRPGDRVAIVGGSEETVALLSGRLAGVKFLQHQPPMGLMQNPRALASAAKFISDAHARFTFIAVGSPQQELIALLASRLPTSTGTALCIGAAIEFVVGQQVRAPRVIQRMGLEWAHRLMQNPFRLWRRYLWTGPRIFLIALTHHREKRRDGH